MVFNLTIYSIDSLVEKVFHVDEETVNVSDLNNKMHRVECIVPMLNDLRNVVVNNSFEKETNSVINANQSRYLL